MVAVEEAYMPLTLSVPDITDAQFQEFCEEYADYRLEYTAEGDLIIMPPTDSTTSYRNAVIVARLLIWVESTGRGKMTESSGGFLLPSGARYSPDAAWISRERDGRQPTCPEFVIELLSPSDRRNKLHKKMADWIDNGAELGWLIDPRNRSVTVYRAGREPEVLTGVSRVAGEGPVEGFILDLEPVWNAGQ